jgi:RNA-directed DNA polymerase
VRIPKKGKRGETRPLGIPTMHDRAMQALYALALDPVAETTADRHSFGFRKGRSAQDASQQLFILLARKVSPAYVLEGDIKGCFDHISHTWLLGHVPMDRRVLAQFLKAGFMEQGKWHGTDEGTPQGGIISPILANIALDGMERMLAERFMLGKTGRRSNDKAGMNKVHLVRYADDFVVTAATPEVAAQARELVEAFLAERGLELSREKTLVTHINDGFDFLGWSFRKYRGKLLIKPSKKSIDSFVREMHRCILRESGNMGQEELIRLLTPKIRGFANYHRHTCASKAFSKIDHIIYHQLERWACRRHPKKHKGWVYSKYWSQRGGNRYMFGKAGGYLPHIAWQHIVRHTPLKTDMNPYIDQDYFARRRAHLRMKAANSFRMPAAGPMPAAGRA